MKSKGLSKKRCIRRTTKTNFINYKIVQRTKKYFILPQVGKRKKGKRGKITELTQEKRHVKVGQEYMSKESKHCVAKALRKCTASRGLTLDLKHNAEHILLRAALLSRAPK